MLEYDLASLWQETQLHTGMEVVLQFHHIHDGLQDQAIQMVPWIKVIHLEVDVMTQMAMSKWIVAAHSSKAMDFPFGVKMHLVPSIQDLTTLFIWTKVAQLWFQQEHFLTHMETS